MKVRYLTPLIIFFILGIFLYIGLNHESAPLPSALINKPIPKFSLPLLTPASQYLSYKDIKGKVALLNIWATWCYSCQAEHPTLMRIARTGVVPIYSIDYKDDRSAAEKWLHDLGNPYQATGFDSAGYTVLDWGVYGTPETFVIDKDGVIRYRHVGVLTWQDWQHTILPLVTQLRV